MINIVTTMAFVIPVYVNVIPAMKDSVVREGYVINTVEMEGNVWIRMFALNAIVDGMVY